MHIRFIALLVALALVRLAAQPSPQDLFERARMLEESNRNLTEAIALYAQVAAQSKEREVAATAQLRIGLLHERLGQKLDAQRAFSKVVDEYPDQTEVARLARSKLPPPGPAFTGGLAARQLWTGAEVNLPGGVSLDGRYTAYVEPAGGDVAVRDLASGQSRRVTRRAPGSEEFALNALISPDGRQVAYAWWNTDSFFELRLAGVNGSEPRPVYRNREFGYIEVAAWSSDGTRMLAVGERGDGTTQIALVIPADRTFRVLKSLQWQWPGGLSLSPDGRFIAYDLPQAEDSASRDIFILSVDGTTETRAISHVADDMNPVWSPDGKGLIFVSDRTGSLDGWLVPIEHGRPTGPPRIVKKDLGRARPLGFSAQGALYYSVQMALTDVYVAPIDPATGHLLSTPSPASQRFVGSNHSPDWSPDGARLAFKSDRGRAGSGRATIVVRDVETGSERDITPKLAYFHRPRWSADGRSFLVQGRAVRGPHGLYRIDATSGDVSPVVQSDPDVPTTFQVASPNRVEIFYNRHHATSPRVVAFDLDRGIEREVYSGMVSEIAPSPDGRTLALIIQDTAARARGLAIVAASGGQARELLKPTHQGPVAYFGGLSWSADGRHLLFVRESASRGDLRELWRIDVESGTTEKLALSLHGLGYVRSHPTGGRITFHAGERREEVWVVEHLLAPLGPSITAGRR